MTYNCKGNSWLDEGFALIFQVVFIFTFLTVFFFAYVVKVEKDEFKEQINYIIDNILTNKIKDLIPSEISKEMVVAIIAGSIDTLEFKAKKGAESSVKDVLKNNDKVRKGAFKTLGIVIGVLIIITIILLIGRFCLWNGIAHQVNEALWVVLFVGLTELAFLTLVASKYKSAEPNKVKRQIGSAIITWIKNHHHN